VNLHLVETPEDWSVVAWLWQAFRHDMAWVTGGLPREDGRYSTRLLDPAPGSEDHAGYLWWEQGEHGRAPVGVAVVSGLVGTRRHILGFWVAPPTRRTGLGLRLALEVIERHPPPWSIAFQHDNLGAGDFWRRVADAAFGPRGVAWGEAERAVPGRPELPPDHWVETL
jgi:hypothetical protein